MINLTDCMIIEAGDIIKGSSTCNAVICLQVHPIISFLTLLGIAFTLQVLK
jgi:2',3'-cyclic-nucleotide 2'-phosphodiesterase (5'-nucleotidase family)